MKGRILEIGTGKGRFLAALLRRVPRITTIDVDAEEQRFARMNVAHEERKGTARFLVADAAELPWRDRTFDAVVSMNALHHMTDITRVLQEVVRVIRPGGKIVLADFDRAGYRIMDRIHRRDGRAHQRETYTFGDVAKTLKAAGWRSVRHAAAGQEVLVATGGLGK